MRAVPPESPCIPTCSVLDRIFTKEWEALHTDLFNWRCEIAPPAASGEQRGRSSSMVIRRARDSDFSGIEALLSEAGRSPRRSALRSTLEKILLDPQMELVLGVPSPDRFAGLMCLHQVPLLSESGCRISVKEFLIHPAHQGEGIGARLLGFARHYARSLGAARLEMLVLEEDHGPIKGICQASRMKPSRGFLYEIDLTGDGFSQPAHNSTSSLS